MPTLKTRHGIAIAAVLLCPLVALGQPSADSDELSAVLDCAEIEREILRLECYDDAVAALRRGLESDADAPASDRRDAQPPEAVADAAPAGRGADEDEDRPVTIVEVRTNVPGRAVFVTDEGKEFVQTSGRIRLFLPDVPFQAELRFGAVGGTFLTPEGTRRSIRIAERD